MGVKLTKGRLGDRHFSVRSGSRSKYGHRPPGSGGAASKTNPAKRSRNTGAPDKQGRNKGRDFKSSQWRPGQSGNPAGRPKRKRLEEVILTLLDQAPKKGTHETRLDQLAAAFVSEAIDNRKLIAMKELLDRLWPKLSRVELANEPDNPPTDPGPDLSKLSTPELREYRRLLLKSARDGGS